MAHTLCMLDKQGYMHARAYTRSRAREPARTHTFARAHRHILCCSLLFHGKNESRICLNITSYVLYLFCQTYLCALLFFILTYIHLKLQENLFFLLFFILIYTLSLSFFDRSDGRETVFQPCALLIPFSLRSIDVADRLRACGYKYFL
jgi:hypothetical protein